MTDLTPENESAAGVELNLARHGKLSYIQIPAKDAAALGEFYSTVFGWEAGGRPEHVSFRDSTGEVIGAFVTNLPPANEPGILPYVYVEGLDGVVGRIREHGGEIVREPYAEGDLWVATFRDPSGNVMGIWQAGGR